MAFDPKPDLLGIAFTQLFILSFTWTFYAAVRINNTIVLPDATAVWVHHNPTATTIVVTVIATIVSAITLSCFTRAAKHALRQYMGNRGYISLADLGTGIAATTASFIFKCRPRYLGRTLVTLIIAAVFGLVNSAYAQVQALGMLNDAFDSWTTLLSPVPVKILVPINGEELDLSNQEFDAVLGRDMNDTFGFSNGILGTEPGSSNSLNSFIFTAGLTVAGVYATGEQSNLNFNKVSYNISSGGILSAAPGYGSTPNMASKSAPGTPASFGGGPVPAILQSNSHRTGLYSTYDIIQQGLTANVTCYNYTNPADWYPIEVQNVPVYATLDMSGNVSGIFPVVNTTLPRMSCNRDSSEVGMTASTAAVSLNNLNFLGSVVCPYMWQDVQDAQRIVTYHTGVGKYASLPPTICEIVPLLTQSTVTYDVNRLVTTIPQIETAIPYQHNLNYWVALFIQQGEWGFQDARVNSLGNMLLSLSPYYESTFSEAPVQSYQNVLEYWKGAIELMGTALRSGYTAYPQNVTSMQIPIRGTQNIYTMGWSFQANGRDYSLIPITLAAFMTFGASAFTIYQIRLSKRLEGRANSTLANVHGDQLSRLVVPRSAIRSFDASNPIHLIVASSAQHPGPGPGPGPQTMDWEQHESAKQGRNYWEQHENSKVLFQLEA